ncbi:hypothetical protein C2845_PM18G03860 [Panicum miliaceum]|uniref:DUF295 domain-containing protein n=1 Tax=Panicum miliaceum TaxID=4540 RepID=A0A3L6PKP2_PANMI|nr:hypothetical protein C2845_PM18G03860 [Panicum miliaceum]
MAAPPPPSRSWAGLPVAFLHAILRRVPCPDDRRRACLVCRAWRAAVAGLPPTGPPRALPWLLLPKPGPDGSTRAACCALGGCGVHRHLTVAPRGARCFGSHDGAWLFLHFREPRSHQLLDVPTGRARELPAALLARTGLLAHDMAVLAAALSSSPDDAGCVAVAIVASGQDDPAAGAGASAAVPPRPRRRRCVAFWRMGWPRAYEIAPPGAVAPLDAEDVVYHDGAFHLLLTHGEHVHVCTPALLPNGFRTDWEERRFHPGGRTDDGQHVRARYLVVSRGELLMVVRFADGPAPPWTTSSFKVFRATRWRMLFPELARSYPWAWSELDALGGRMLFVGYGCSRSYEVDQYPGFKDGVYFLDDGKLYDEAVIFGNDDLRQYPCGDNGKWSQGHVQRCFPRPDASDHSPPAWLLP